MQVLHIDSAITGAATSAGISAATTALCTATIGSRAVLAGTTRPYQLPAS